MASVTSPLKRPLPSKKRGSYNCGRCGLPKKGHVCALAPSEADAAEPSPRPPRSGILLRRALSFDDDVAQIGESPLLLSHQAVQEDVMEEEFVGVGTAGLVPLSSLVEVLKRVPVKGLLSAAAVCHGWRECVKRMWRSAEELSIKISLNSQIGFIESILEKCVGLVRLTLRMKRLEL
jgi:F-box domain